MSESVHPVFQFATTSFVLYQSVFMCTYFFKGVKEFDQQDDTVKAFLIVGGTVSSLLLLFSLVSTISLIHYDVNFENDEQLKWWLVIIMVLIFAWAIAAGFLFGTAHFQYFNPQLIQCNGAGSQDYTAKSTLAQQFFQIGGVVSVILWIITILLFRHGATEITTTILQENVFNPFKQNVIAPIQESLQRRQKESQAAADIAQLRSPEQLQAVLALLESFKAGGGAAGGGAAPAAAAS